MEQVAAYIALGANLGDRQENISQAIEALRKTPGIAVQAVSTLLETEPIGLIEQPKFLNCVAGIQTTLAPAALMDVCLAIEKQLGRVRIERWGPRLIDLDILLYGKQSIHEENLTIPHPEIANRPFVQAGLQELHAQG